MSPRVRVKDVLSEAEEREKSYDWAEAVKLYEQALVAVRKDDFIKKGQIQERISYALYRAGMQSESVDEFRNRMHQVSASYERAKKFYGKLGRKEDQLRKVRCDAMIAYVGYWLASKMPLKKEMLHKCWRLTKEALRVFSEMRDASEYGKTYNQLSISAWFSWGLEDNFQVRKNMCKEVVEHGEQAIKFLSTCRDSRELARAYVNTANSVVRFGYDFHDLNGREKFLQEGRVHWEKAKKLSEEVAFLEPSLSLLLLDCGGGGTDEGQKNLEKVLEYAWRTRDRLVVGYALEMLAYQTALRHLSHTEDPQRSLLNMALKYAEDAKRQYSAISFVSSGTGGLWPEAPCAEFYCFQADGETDLSKRRGLLQKAIEATPSLLNRAEEAGFLFNMNYAHHVSSKIFTSRAMIETNDEEKRRLLEKALRHRNWTMRYYEQQNPFGPWNRGLSWMYLARIKFELAKSVKYPGSEKNMLQKAVTDAERGLKLCIEHLAFRESRGMISPLNSPLSSLQYEYGNCLKRLYDITRNSKYSLKAIEAFGNSAKLAQKLDLVSRVAESHWRIAQIHDALGKHLKAVESFESASESYRFAAEKFPQFSDFYLDFSLYMRAWAEIEGSRLERENEGYAKSSEHYCACSRLLETTKKWSYLSPYYFAWSLLDRGENLSRLDKPQDAMKAFNEAGRIFGDSAIDLREKAGQLENSDERDGAFKLASVAGLRRQYCMGRVLMEEATLSSGKGDRVLSAEKYASAARIFEEIAPNFDRDEAREELRFAVAICEAWEKMEFAEERGDAVLYKKASELFAEASEISRRKIAALTAMGNSCFCEALEIGMKFMATSNTDFYSEAKLRMENAAGYYRRAGFEKPALWVEATKRLFDAYVYVGKAEAEPDPEKRVRYFLMAEKCLGLSARFFGRAGYGGKKNETLQYLEKVRKERELAFSLSEVLTAPTVLTSATGVSMHDMTEKAVGLNGFESVNIRASTSVPGEFVPNEEFEVKLDLANVGKGSGLLVRIEGLVPPRCEVLRLPSYCVLEGSSLNMKGKRLDPLCVESVSVWVQIADVVGVSLSPNVVYVDELGNFKTTKVEEVRILPVVKFESAVAQVVFNYLVDAFVEDCVKWRLGVDKSGWRSFPQIIKGAGVSKRSLYGTGGRIGHGLSELQRKGLVEVETLLGERGRGGHILKVRIHHAKELVRRYVKEKAPNLLT